MFRITNFLVLYLCPWTWLFICLFLYVQIHVHRHEMLSTFKRHLEGGGGANHFATTHEDPGLSHARHSKTRQYLARSGSTSFKALFSGLPWWHLPAFSGQNTCSWHEIYFLLKCIPFKLSVFTDTKNPQNKTWQFVSMNRKKWTVFCFFFTAASCFVLRLQVVSDFAFCCGHSLITKKCCILIYFQWFIKKEMCLLFTMLMIKSIWISTFKQRPFCLCSPGTSTLLSVKLRDTQDLTTAHISLSATKIMAI